MSVSVTWKWKCDVPECGNEHIEQQNKLYVGSHILRFDNLPEGWSLVEWSLVCPKHYIDIKTLEE